MCVSIFRSFEGLDTASAIRFIFYGNARIAQLLRDLNCSSGARQRQVGYIPMIHPALQVSDDAIDILVMHRSEYRMSIRMKSHVIEILRQCRGCMRIMRNIQNDGRPSRQDLEATRQIDQRQTAADILRADRQTMSYRFKRSQYRRCVEQLIGAAQTGIGKRVAALAAAAVIPLLLVARIIEIAPEQP